MHHIHSTEGIIIGGVESGDSSRKVLLFTRTMGLIMSRVQNGRSLHSKLRPSVQDFTFGRFSLVRGKNDWRVVGADLECNIYESLKSSKAKIYIAANVLNLIKKLISEGTDIQEIFDITKKFMLSLPRIEVEDLKSAECLLLLQILKSLGFLRLAGDLEKLSENHSTAVELINESLQAAGVTNP